MQNQTDFQKIIILLQENADNEFAKTALASYIAAKAFEPGHLYSDMGMSSRAELNKLMTDNYHLLAKKRPPEIRWKKFLFDEINSVAPACYECRDLQNCFKCNILEGG
ncbi:MAG: nitrogen fixation protein NifQ [Campylobacterales bacterium]